MKGTFEVIFSTTVFVVAISIGLYFDFTRPIAIGMLLVVGAAILMGFVMVGNAHKDAELLFSQRREQEVQSKNARLYARLRARNAIKRIVGQHKETLARRRLALVRVDQYGVADGTAWSREVQHFADKVIRPGLSDEEAESITGDGQFSSLFQELIEDVVRTRVEEIEEGLTFSDSMSPREFEMWCAKELEKHGWACLTTKFTGDQGADVVAEKKTGKSKAARVVIQCKLYNSPVGNKAVQEAHAAKAHYVADYAAVVSNSEFTPSAKQLAQSTKVFLWHFSDLERIDQLLLGSKV